MPLNHEVVDILVVDDDIVSHMLAKRVLADLQCSARLLGAEDGVEALEILRGEHPDKRIGPKHVILLDLRMPRMSGLEFLTELRKDPDLHKSTVFVLTTSNQKEDVERAYEHNVAGYLVKPMEYEPLIRMMTMVDSYCQVVAFPTVNSRRETIGKCKATVASAGMEC